MSSEANYKLFETKHVLRILVFLHLCGPKSKSDIYRAVSTNPRMAYKLDLMEAYGLVAKKPKESGSRREVYDLTPRGESCATMFCRMEEASGVSVSELRSDFIKDSIPFIERGCREKRRRRGCTPPDHS
ncbi:MAG: winged helix-turn-helix transcriptional regulator [Candidatus Methanomethylophilaceae archaeon]|nr:winged helix-turn-helix transcriptional regulator [Candidatus Methanomethylophilaceae archaeon]